MKISMLAGIAKCCFEQVVKVASESNDTQAMDFGLNDESFHISIGGQRRFDITVEDVDVDEGEIGNGRTLEEVFSVSDEDDMCVLGEDSTHSEILDACLEALFLSDSPTVIRDLTTDGDGNDCEIIFEVVDYGHVAIKVR